MVRPIGVLQPGYCCILQQPLAGVVSTRRAAATCRGGSYSKGSYKYLFAVNGIKYPANLWGTSSRACLLAMSLILSKYLIMLMIFCIHSGWCDRCDHDISINSHGIISNRTYQVWMQSVLLCFLHHVRSIQASSVLRTSVKTVQSN